MSAKVITTLTTLSLSAIATNTRVKGGGAYFLISRSLGVEFGGAIGLVFFLAQAISVAMYVIGFSEAAVAVLPENEWSITAIATITNVLVFVSVFIGAGWAIESNTSFWRCLQRHWCRFTSGRGSNWTSTCCGSMPVPHFTLGENFFTMFALFFPAVTGIMAGANMSGDLRDPARSIPRGTLAAVGVTAVVYLSQAVLLAGARTSAELIDDKLVMADIARWPMLDYRGRVCGHALLRAGQHDGRSAHPAGLCAVTMFSDRCGFSASAVDRATSRDERLC